MTAVEVWFHRALLAMLIGAMIHVAYTACEQAKLIAEIEAGGEGRWLRE